MGGSTPRQYSFGLPTPLGMAGALRGISRTNSSVSAGTPPPLLTYPSMPTEAGRSGGLEEQESGEAYLACCSSACSYCWGIK